MVALVAMVALGAGTSNAAISVAPGAIGDTLLAAYYDVRDIPSERDSGTWQNFFTIHNTSNSWVAAHLRFRAYASSIEVWDHIILLSPYDVFWGYLERIPGGGVRIASSDKETLTNSGLEFNTPAAAPDHWADTFKTRLIEVCGFPTDNGAAVEAGEMEVIGLWTFGVSTSHSLLGALKATYGQSAVDFDRGFDFYTAFGEAGKINVYDILQKEWGNGNRPGVYGGAAGVVAYPGQTVAVLRDCPNVLTGSMELGDTITGQYYSYNLVALQNFRTDDPSTTGPSAMHRDEYLGGAIVYPVSSAFTTVPFDGTQCFGVTAETAYYLNPDWATTHGPTLRDGDSILALPEPPTLNRFNQAFSLDDVEAALNVSEVWAFYYKDFMGSVYTTDAIVSFPTKYLHFFFAFRPTDFDGVLSVVTQWPFWQQGAPNVPAFTTCGQYWALMNQLRGKLYELWSDPEGFRLAGYVVLNGRVWDTEQNEAGIEFVSPHIYFPNTIINEVNIVRFGKDDGQGTAYIDVDEDFDAGQFMLTGWTLPTGERLWDTLVVPGALPMIGGTVRLHSANAVKYRATMVPWAFR